MFSWILFGAIVVTVVIGLLLLFRSLSRWAQPPAGKDPEAQAAEARLWSTKNYGGR